MGHLGETEPAEGLTRSVDVWVVPVANLIWNMKSLRADFARTTNWRSFLWRFSLAAATCAASLLRIICAPLPLRLSLRSRFLPPDTSAVSDHLFQFVTYLPGKRPEFWIVDGLHRGEWVDG